MKSNVTTKPVAVSTYTFTKEKGLWYIDFPEFIRQGYGVKADLMMVAGADTLLDLIANHGYKASLTFSAAPFTNCNGRMQRIGKNINQSIYNLADLGIGAYYNVTTYQGRPFQHQLWLCPVTLHIFDGEYPNSIYFQPS